MQNGLNEVTSIFSSLTESANPGGVQSIKRCMPCRVNSPVSYSCKLLLMLVFKPVPICYLLSLVKLLGKAEQLETAGWWVQL